jgi:hypothetical protein
MTVFYFGEVNLSTGELNLPAFGAKLVAFPNFYFDAPF